MYAQQLVYWEGGATTVMGETLPECLAKAKEKSERIKGLYGVTVAYEVWKAQHYQFNVYDVSIPEAFRADLGEEFMKRYLQSD